MYAVVLRDYVSDEFAPMVEDMIRLSTIQVVVQALYAYHAPDGAAAMDAATFLSMLCYLNVGIAIYWLVIKRVVLP